MTIEKNSHPLIADINGDFLDDVLYTDSSSGQIKVAFQAVVGGDETFIVKDFSSSIPMAKPEDGCLTRSSSNVRLTSPHSASMIDFDGDCMSDLFLTVQDASSGAKYYEIWIRRETQTVIDLNTNQVTKPKVTEDGSLPKD